MDYEQKHPISQEIYEYLKNTPKEEIDKDWSYILKETNTESYYEQKYKEALERARVYHTGGGTTDIHITEIIFPELKESEDEKIRKEIIRIFKGETRYTSKEDTDKYIAWLESKARRKN